MSVDMLKKQLKSGEFSRLYVIYGEEDYLKDFYCKRITSKAVTDYESFNIQRFDSGNFDVNTISAAIDNLPLMSEHKCVVLRDIDPEKLRADDWKQLHKIIKESPPESIIIYYFDALRPNPKKDTRFKSLLADAQKDGLALEINKPAPAEINKFITKRAVANGCTISDRNASYLVDSVGSAFNTLGCELDKACAHARGNAVLTELTDSKELIPVDKENIDAVAVKPLSFSIYDLARSAVVGNRDRSMSIIDELFYKKEEPVIILSALSGTFCDLYRARAALLSGVKDTSIITDFKYQRREFAVRKAMSDSRDMSINFLADCLSLLMKADSRIKGSKIDNRVVLEELIVEIGIASGRYRGA